MASNRAPGVRIKEIDLSEVVEPAGTGVGAIVGRTPKGMTNQRVLTTSNKNFVAKFGSPVKGNSNEWPIYTALEYLKASDYLWFTRPAGENDEVGYATFSFDDSQFDNTKTAPEAPSGGIYAVAGFEDGNKPNKYYPAEKTTAIANADLGIVALGASEENANIGIIVVTENNTETSGIEYTYGYTWAGQYPETDINGNAVKYYRINVYVKQTGETIHDAGWDDLDALKTLVPAESWIVSNNPTAKDYSGKSMFVKDVVNGYSNYIYVNAKGSAEAYDDTKFYPEAGWEILDNSAIAKATSAVKAAGSDASAPDSLVVEMSSTSPALAPSGKQILLSVAMEVTAVEDWTLSYAGNQLVLTNDADSTKKGYYTIPGWTVTAVDGAQIAVVTGKANLTGGSLSVTAEDTAYAVAGTFTSTDVLESVAPGVNLKGKNVVALPAGSYTMGTDGVVEALENLYKSKEQVGVDFFMAPYADDACVKTVCDIARTRGGDLAIVPANTDIETTDPTTLVENLKSYLRNSYTYIIAGADLVYDSYTSRNIYLPKVCFVGRIMMDTINANNVWTAPAGLTRGAMGTLDQLRVYTEAEIGYMYNNSINTSKRVRGQGDFLWGEKTGLPKHTALDRVHVRNLLNNIENTLEPQLQAYLFEANTETLRSRVKSGIDQFLETIYAGGGLYAWNTVCDSSNNTAYTIDNEELNIDIYLQPVKDIEFINVNVIVTRTGVSFTEA